MTDPASAPSILRSPNAYLLACLLGIIVLPPFVAGAGVGSGLFECLLFCSLIAGAGVTVRSRGRFLVLTSVAALAVTTRVVWLVAGVEALGIPCLAVYVAFYSLVACMMLAHLLKTGEAVTADTIFGALSVYLVLGFLWSIAFALLELAASGSFDFGSAAGERGARVGRFIGFSFTTLTTLGYGNIAPATPKADALTTLEAIAGQAYLAIVVARLIALQLMHGGRKDAPV